MARATGFEPATSTVTGWHSNQLSYAPAISCMKLNIHPGLEKSKLKREKSTKKVPDRSKNTAETPLKHHRNAAKHGVRGFLFSRTARIRSAGRKHCYSFARKKFRALKKTESAVY